jgi:hypothetical protein
MISYSSIDSCKALAETLANLVPGGVLFGLLEGDTVVWVKGSDSLELDVLSVGKRLDANSTSMQALREKKVLTQNVPRAVYGTRLSIVSIPIINDNGEAMGIFGIAMPKLHPVVAAFENFAPILAEMFHEGSFLYTTDLEKVISRQPSAKFDMPSIPMDYKLQEVDVPYKVIKSKQPVMTEVDASKYGVPISVASYPLFDEDNKEEIVATLGIALPKKTAATLREMSNNLENGLSGIAAAIEELAASATDIHTNEQSLNENI